MKAVQTARAPHRKKTPVHARCDRNRPHSKHFFALHGKHIGAPTLITDMRDHQCGDKQVQHVCDQGETIGKSAPTKKLAFF